MAEPLIILGTGGNACDLLDIVEALNALRPVWAVIGFLDDGRAPGSEFLGFPVLGTLREAALHDARFINAIGSEKSFRDRPRILASTGLKVERFATLIHPGAGVSSRAQIGRGVAINFGVSVAGRVNLGDHVSLGVGCTIGHDAILEDYTIVAPGAVLSGSVHVGSACYIGAAACIRQQIRIGSRALVGMGAVVVKNVPDCSVVVGNPARPLIEPNAKNQEKGV